MGRGRGGGAGGCKWYLPGMRGPSRQELRRRDGDGEGRGGGWGKCCAPCSKGAVAKSGGGGTGVGVKEWVGENFKTKVKLTPFALEATFCRGSKECTQLLWRIVIPTVGN